ncbi:hypothetical protein Back2_02520 [Nocardioides baekrokdamisoli]|uniref:DUF3093 domain-containing protein n=2 Tax=Nocardioides baekrokdamisoli TaxID=1804624 RepID=A0A3G9IIT9_9ACTN|nr:hypothetical protein Back2_02520 [Nocardioides baekrokdamisoli]
MFIATVFIAVFLWVPGVLAWTIIGTIVLLFALAMQSYGSAAIEVRDGWLYAGKAKIQTTYLGSAQSLTAEEAWQIAGPKADARAYLLLRPYLRRAVKVELNDPADRTPYWLLASRHPDALAAALAAEIISD